MANCVPRAQIELIFGSHGRGWRKAVAFVLTAILLLLLLTTTQLTSNLKTIPRPTHTKLSNATDRHNSPFTEHSSSNSSNSSSSSNEDNGGSTRLYSERLSLLPPSTPLPPPLPKPPGERGGGAPKPETVFTARSYHGATVTNAALASIVDRYRTRVLWTPATDVTLRHLYPADERDNSREQLIVTRNQSSPHPAVAATSERASAAPADTDAGPGSVSATATHAPLLQPSTSASSSIVRAGVGVAVAKATSATTEAEKTTKNDGQVSLETGAGTSVVTEATMAIAPTKADDVTTVYIGLNQFGGRIGNRMFQYASGLGLALRYGLRAVLVVPDETAVSSLDALRRVFRLSPLPTLFARPPPFAAVDLVESSWGRYDAARFDRASTFEHSVYTVGFFQSWKYFAPVAERLRREFALTADAERTADSYFRSVGLPLLSEGSGEARPLRVGVHVRRGDMLRLSNLYTVAPAEYLLKAIAHYRRKYAAPAYNVSFIFATDDRVWVHDFVASRLQPDIAVFYVSLDVGGDMAVLSRCDHSIITSGTFGWWSAWLAGGDVVYYRDFIRPESPLYAGHDPADYYPSSWLGLSA